jgi:hypothetical protein
MLLTISLALGAGDHFVIEPELLVAGASIGVTSLLSSLNVCLSVDCAAGIRPTQQGKANPQAEGNASQLVFVRVPRWSSIPE